MSYTTLREKIAADKVQRNADYAKYADAWRAAHDAGMAAGKAAQCVPMAVYNGDIQINGRPLDPYAAASQLVDVVPDGVCGFAWVVLHPATSRFARWASANRGARREYGGGLCLTWVSEFGQSMTRKEAYAHAFAATLRRELNLNVHAHSRMD